MILNAYGDLLKMAVGLRTEGDPVVAHRVFDTKEHKDVYYKARMFEAVRAYRTCGIVLTSHKGEVFAAPSAGV